MTLPRRSFIQSVAAALALPFAGKGRAAEPGRFTPDGQPMPLRSLIVRHQTPSGWVTAIWRQWRQEDVSKCKLCEPGRCCAVGDSCMLLSNVRVKNAAADLYSTIGHEWLDDRGPD